MKRTTLLRLEIDFLVRQPASDAVKEGAFAQELAQAIDTRIPTRHCHRALAEALLHNYFDIAVQHYGSEHFSSVYSELHAVLERMAIAIFPSRIANAAGVGIVAALIERRTLSELAPHFLSLGQIDKADMAFISRLAAIRNGVAHRNLTLLGKHVHATAPAHSIKDFKFRRGSTAQDIASCIELVIKLARPFKRKHRAK